MTNDKHSRAIHERLTFHFSLFPYLDPGNVFPTTLAPRLHDHKAIVFLLPASFLLNQKRALSHPPGMLEQSVDLLS